MQLINIVSEVEQTRIIHAVHGDMCLGRTEEEEEDEEAAHPVKADLDTTHTQAQTHTQGGSCQHTGYKVNSGTNEEKGKVFTA